jgi:hypothetical protein
MNLFAFQVCIQEPGPTADAAMARLGESVPRLPHEAL